MIYSFLMIIDVIIGLLSSYKNGTHKTSIMKQGLYKKVAEVFVIIALVLCNRVAGICGLSIPVLSFLIAFFCFKEFSSIIENSILLGVPVPKQIVELFSISKILDKINIKDKDRD